MEEDNYSEISSSPMETLSPGHRLSGQWAPTSPPPNINKPKLRPPLPPQKPPISPPSPSENAMYEDPNFLASENQFSPDFQDDAPEDLYEGSISKSVLSKLNRQPPPVWKNPANSSAPPPLPPTRQKRFTRSMERGTSGVLDSSEFDFPRGPPPPLPNRSLRDESPKHRKRLPLPPNKRPPSPLLPKKPKPRQKAQAATPPGRSATPPGRLMGVDFRADLGSKLKQRKTLTKSWSEDDQMHYEDVEYRGNSASPISPRERLLSSESDTGSYVDCDPNEPQAYLDYQFRNSYLPEPPTSLPPRQEELPLPLPPREPRMLTPSPPLPSRTNIGRQPVVKAEEEAPPVPRRHPHASGRGTLPLPPTPEPPRSNSPSNALPLPPRTVSPSHSPLYEDDEAPPVPVRGAETTRPPLNRPSSNESGSRGPKPRPQRGISAPSGATRPPIPIPKTSRDRNETEDDVFEAVNFNNIHKESLLPPPPVPKSKKLQIITEDVPSSKAPPKSTRLPIQVPTGRESSPKPKTPALSSKPKFPVPPQTKPKATSPQPEPFKPTAAKPPKKYSADQPNEPEFKRRPVQRDNDFRKKSPPSPESRKKLPEPSSFQEIMERRKKLADAAVEREVDLRKKLPTPPSSPERKPRPPFHNGVESRKKHPEPSPNRMDARGTLSTNDGENRYTSSPAPRSPGMRKKPPPNSPKKPPIHAVPSGQEMARKPPPVSKAKPVLKHLQNSELADCLRNNGPELKRAGGHSSSNHKPMAPPKPKPLIPPRP